MRTAVCARKRAGPWRYSPMRGALGGADLFGGRRGSAVQTLRHGGRHVGRHLHAKGPRGAAGPFLESLPAGATPAAEPAAHPRKSRPAIRSPSATCDRLDRRKILRRSGDIVGPARGLRVGCQAADAANKTAIATESVTLRIDVSFYCRDVPLVCPKPVDLTRSAVLVHIDDCSVCGGVALGADTDVPMRGQTKDG